MDVVNILENNEEIIAVLKKIKFTQEINRSEEDKIDRHIYDLCSHCIPKKLNKSEDVPYNEEDFATVAHDTLPYLKCFHNILKLFDTEENLNPLKLETVKDILLNALVIASHFQNESYDWSNQECSALAHHTLDFLVRFSKSTSLSNFLIGKECGNEYFCKIFPKSILKLFLYNFSEKITKSTWKSYPHYVESYMWILLQVKAPHLAEYNNYFLPAALFILDDWEQRHKIIGIKALYHILCNTPHSEIRWYGRAEVVYDALKTHIFSREHELLSHVYPAAILAASILESDPKNKGHIQKKYFDHILSHLFREMAHEEKLTHRTIYALALKQMCEAMAISMVRWSKDLLEICSKYLATYEGEKAQDRLIILEVLQVYIKNCWPRVHAHVEEILKMILKLAYELTSDEPPVLNKETLISEIKQVITLLMAAAPATVTECTKDLMDLNIPDDNFVKTVISETVFKNP